MFTAKMKPNIAAVNATSMTVQGPRLSGQITQKTKTGVGYGLGIFVPMVMAEWALGAFRKLPTERYGKRSTGLFRRGWFWTTSAENEPASIRNIFAWLLSVRTIILEKSCERFSRGAASTTLLQNITDSTEPHRQPDLFVPKPETPKQEAMDV